MVSQELLKLRAQFGGFRDTRTIDGSKVRCTKLRPGLGARGSGWNKKKQKKLVEDGQDESSDLSDSSMSKKDRENWKYSRKARKNKPLGWE